MKRGQPDSDGGDRQSDVSQRIKRRHRLCAGLGVCKAGERRRKTHAPGVGDDAVARLIKWCAGALLRRAKTGCGAIAPAVW